MAVAERDQSDQMQQLIDTEYQSTTLHMHAEGTHNSLTKANEG